MKVIPEKKKIKPKNNYSKLRSQKNSLQNRLNIANRTVKLQIDEIKRLLNVLDTEQRVNQILENRVNLEVEEKTIAYEKLAKITKEKNDYYDWYLEEIDKKTRYENKLVIGLTIAATITTALVAVIIKGV